jgi:hypothetical protein
MGRTACTEHQCLYKGALYLYLTVELYLYSPYGPYGLYKGALYLLLFTNPLQTKTNLLHTLTLTSALTDNTLYFHYKEQ